MDMLIQLLQDPRLLLSLAKITFAIAGGFYAAKGLHTILEKLLGK